MPWIDNNRKTIYKKKQKPKTDGAKNRTFRSSLRAVTTSAEVENLRISVKELRYRMTELHRLRVALVSTDV